MKTNPNQSTTVKTISSEALKRKTFVNRTLWRPQSERPAANFKSPPNDLSVLKEMIGRRLIKLPPQMLRVIRYALENPTDVAFANASSVARNCEVADSTVSRAARTVGFQHFKEFRELFRRELRHLK